MKKTFILSFVAFTLLLAMPEQGKSQGVTAQADSLNTESLMNMSLEELMNLTVSTASKGDEKIQEAPANISVITAKEIKSFGALTLVDVLNRATSLYVTGSYYFPNNLAAIRGDAQTHTTSHVLILIDGRPCRESFYGGVDLAIFNTFPLEAIERIEIIRGPGSVLYGTNAFSGVINILTKKNEAASAQYTAQGGSFGTLGSSFHQSFRKQDVSFSSSVQYLNQNGWDFSATDQAGEHKTMKYGQENIGMSVTGAYKQFSIRSFYGNSLRDILGERPLFPKDGSFNKLRTHRGFLDVGYEHQFSSKWHTTVNATYNSFSQHSIRDERPVDFSSKDGLLEMTHFVDPLENLHVIAGVLTNYVTGVGKGIDKTTNEPVDFVQAYTDLRTSAYAQLDYQPVKFIKLIAGGQLNKTPHASLDFVPRAGAIVSITPSIGLKALYGEAFKSAAKSEMNTFIPGINYGNPALKPEKIRTTDLQLFMHKSNYQLTVGYFFSKQTNTVVRVPYLENAITYANQGSIHMQGMEIEGQAKPFKALTLLTSLAYQTNTNNEGEKDVTAIANLMVKTGIIYDITQGFTVGVHHAHFSKPADIVNSQTQLEPARQRKVVNPVPASFHLLSLNVSGNVTSMLDLKGFPDLTLFAYANNLLNEKVYNPEFSRRNINSLPAMGGRALYGGVTIKF